MTSTTALDRALGLVMGKMTADGQERRNVFWSTAATLLAGAGGALFGGELWAGFLTKAGFSMTQIGILSSVGTFAGAFGLLAFMGLADRLRDRIRTYALCVIATTLAPFLTVGVALLPRGKMPLGVLFEILIAMQFLAPLVASITVMLDYPILVRTMSAAIRGRVFAILTTAYGVLAVLLGLISAKVLKDVDFPAGYALCFTAAAMMIFLRAVAFRRLRELPSLAVPGASRSALPFTAIVDVLKMKEFQWLAGPHVLRGMSSAMIVFAIPVSLKFLHLSNQTPGYATSANQMAGILSGIALGLIADRWGAGRSTLFGDVLYGLGLAALVLSHNPVVFLGFLFLMHFGRNLEDSAVPFGCTIIVPAELMGAFSSARLMIMQGSSAFGALLFGYLLDHYNPALVFFLSGVLKLLNGLWFWYVFRLKRTTDPS